MNDGEKNPWVRIPAQDYEAHMAEIGQSAALSRIFARVYADEKPRRLLVLGCTTGHDFELVDFGATEHAVGVDLNRDYLAIARVMLDPRVELVHGDVLAVDLPESSFDFIHAALIFEYVDPVALFRRIEKWLCRGGVCVTVTQNPAQEVAAVSKTPYASLQSLGEIMSLHEPARVDALAAAAGLVILSSWNEELPRGKSFSVSTFRKP